MTDAPSGPRGPFDLLLDLMVYAPLGLVIRAREEIPTLAARGREKFTSEANLAKIVGQLAVSQGRRRVEKLLVRPSNGPEPAAPPDTEDKPRAERPGRAVPVRDLSADPEPPLPVVAPESLPEPFSEAAPAPAPDAVPVPSSSAPDPADLPIPGYDSLSASQVVQRLPGLTPDELEAIRSYEAAGRNRKTVLLRVAQLRAAS